MFTCEVSLSLIKSDIKIKCIKAASSDEWTLAVNVSCFM